MKIKVNVKSWLLVMFYVLSVVSTVLGNSDSNIASVMSYVKWVIGIVAGLVTVSSVGFLMWGLHLKNAGDKNGSDMIKNALWAVFYVSIAWAFLGALVLKGTELNTGVTNIGKGWQ